jgi:hypothetical protein
MSDAAAGPPPPPRHTRSARLLTLIRKLIEYGKEVTASVRKRAFTEPRWLQSSFGTADVAQILASIARALHRADTLEARVVRNASRIDAAGRPRGTPAPRRPRAVPAAAEAKSPIARLPTPPRIVAEVHGQRIGAVLGDICRELGILPGHPLWNDLSLAVDEFGGAWLRLWKDATSRMFRPFVEDWPPGATMSWPPGSVWPEFHLNPRPP